MSRILEALDKKFPMIEIPFRSPWKIRGFLALALIFLVLSTVLGIIERKREKRKD